MSVCSSASTIRISQSQTWLISGIRPPFLLTLSVVKSFSVSGKLCLIGCVFYFDESINSSLPYCKEPSKTERRIKEWKAAVCRNGGLGMSARPYCNPNSSTFNFDQLTLNQFSKGFFQSENTGPETIPTLSHISYLCSVTFRLWPQPDHEV